MINENQLPGYEWLSVPMWVFDCQALRITWANNAALGFWDAASLDELRTRSFDDVTRVTRERLDLARRAACSGQCLEEYWTLYPGGHAKEVLLQSNVVVNSEGPTHGLLFVANNLKALPDIERRGVQVLLYMPMLVALYEFNGRLLYRNPAAVRTWGNLENLSSPLFLQETFANPADAQLIVEYINQGNIFRGECDMRTVAGVRTFDLTCHPGIDPVTGERAIGLSATDVTEHKIMERERDQRENQVREAQADALSERQRTIRARKLFMATASHEQRTPLQTVVGCVDRLEQAPSDMARCLVELKDAAEQLIRINEDLVEFVRADSAPGPRVKAVNARQLIARALLPSQKAAVSKKLTFSLQESDLERDIRIDEMRVRQVISNLASNAVKYTKIGSIAVVAGLDAEAGALALKISIRDTGVGMDEAYAEKVMLPFVRGPESDVVDPQGLGLGLAIVQSHLAELNGEFQIGSSPGAGTTVSVSIPCQQF